MINNTVRRLPVQAILPLITELTRMMQFRGHPNYSYAKYIITVAIFRGRKLKVNIFLQVVAIPFGASRRVLDIMPGSLDIFDSAIVFDDYKDFALHKTVSIERQASPHAR